MSEMRYRVLLHNQIGEEENPDVRRFLEALATSTLPLVEQLHRLLNRDDKQVMEQALHAAFLLRIHELAPTVIQLFEQTTDTKRRSSLAYLLSLSNHEAVIPFFVHHISSPHEPSMRLAMLYYLTSHKWQSIMLEPIVRIIQNPAEEHFLREGAVEVLRAYPDKAARLSLLLPLLQDEVPGVRWQAMWHLTFLGDFSLAHYVEPLLSQEIKIPRRFETIAGLARLVLYKWSEKSQST